jgi:hypothetical protein
MKTCDETPEYSELVIDSFGGPDRKAKPSRNWLKKPRTPWPKRKPLDQLQEEYGETHPSEPEQENLF